MRKGFTLLELLVVVGIMGMLGVAAAGGYSALVRGMTERGAVAAASSLLRAAKERAQVDRSPTVVYCYNRLVKAPTGVDDNGVAVGVMTAVRRFGRISSTSGGGRLLYDEFADLDHNYEYEESESDAKKGGGFRLFKMSGKVNKMEYSIVSDRVVLDDGKLVTLFSGCSDGSSQTNLQMSAFVKTGTTSDHEASWKIGDGYGMEFSEIQLPEGYIFGKTVPSEAGKISSPKVIYFDPDEDSSETIEVWSTKPNASGMPQAFSKAGEASADSKKEV